MKIQVIGAGYVGLVAAACLAKSGHEVLCVEKSTDKLNQLTNGVTPIYEEGLEEIIKDCIRLNKIKFTSKFIIEYDAEIIIIAVGTPSLPNGRVDLSQINSVMKEIVDNTDHSLTIVMKSTVPPGTGETLKQRFLSKAREPISYISNPEFLREGQAVWDWYNPDRIVVGGDNKQAIDKVLELYSDINAHKVGMDITSAEMVKYASNAFLATKISFINEIANLCDLVGADILPVSKAIGMDERIGEQFLKAGLGYGGSCFPKDTRGLDFLSTSYGHTFSLLKAVIEVNQRQRIIVRNKLSQALGSLYGKKIAVLGVAFKPNTDDTREAPSLDIISILLDEGAEVLAYDPVVNSLGQCNRVKITDKLLNAIEGAHAAIVCTEWPQILDADWKQVLKLMLQPKIILDGRNCLNKRILTELGFAYIGIGR